MSAAKNDFMTLHFHAAACTALYASNGHNYLADPSANAKTSAVTAILDEE